MPKYIVTVEQHGTSDGSGLCPIRDRTAKFSSRDLSEVVVEIIRIFNPSRDEQLVARVLIANAEREPDDDYEFWPGYRNAVDSLQDAAAELLRGWSEHDKKIREQAASHRNGE